MSAVVFYYRRSEFITDSKFTIRSVFSTGGSFGYFAARWSQTKLGAVLPHHQCVATWLAFYRSQEGLSLENSEKSLKRGSRGLSGPGSKKLKNSRRRVENEPKARKKLEK